MPQFQYPPVMSRQSFGSLIIELTSDPALGPIFPVSNATVTIKQLQPVGEAVTLGQLTTNSVGQTDPIELEVPPLERSLDPYNDLIPYASYRIEISASHFVDVIVDGTQVFADTRSIQPVGLQATRNSMRNQGMRNSTETIVIGPSTLYGNYPAKIPEPLIIPILPGSGFITLSEVIVPEYIIVHDGSPNDDSAPNYTVPFIQYISNVASSEIYPTWPVETIKANVIAIISFTLNRVFTEWYRNQGKAYTITNSTAYDHAFFYGRNLFDTITPVVREVFDTYIKRPNVTQPLLAQYCDGIKSICNNWMTQWGSKSLGDAGYSAEQILRNFYGNIELATAPEIEGNPESYPGSPLSIGSSGTAVRQIQEQLNRISQNYPLIPKVAVDGIYGENTAEAVNTFQQIFHLPQTGIVNRATWYEISRIFVAVAKLAELL